MNWCKPHWDQLRNKIEEVGLTKFVSDNGERAVKSLTSDAKEDFDPLMEAWGRINYQMSQSPGLRGRLLECPLCILVDDKQPELIERWLDGCLGEVLIRAVDLGLLTKC